MSQGLTYEDRAWQELPRRNTIGAKQKRCQNGKGKVENSDAKYKLDQPTNRSWAIVGLST